MSIPTSFRTLTNTEGASVFIAGNVVKVARNADPKYWLNLSDIFPTLGEDPTYPGSVNSVALTVPTGFSVAGSPVTETGTLAITNAFASGSVVFAMGSGFAQDNSNFFWNDSTNRLGLGTNSSLVAKLHIKMPTATGGTDNAIYASTTAGNNILQLGIDSAATFMLLGNSAESSSVESSLRLDARASGLAFSGIQNQVGGAVKYRSGVFSDLDYHFQANDGANNYIGGFVIKTATGKVYFPLDVNVGGTSNNASALLQIDSTTRGFLPPRMTTTQRDAISSPAEGLVIFNTTSNKLNLYASATWQEVTSS